MKRYYRRPTEEDRKRDKCRAYVVGESKPVYVTWNPEYNVWTIHGRPHILVAVDRILSPKEKRRG